MNLPRIVLGRIRRSISMIASDLVDLCLGDIGDGSLLDR